MLRRIGTLLDMIKVAVREILSTLTALGDLGRIETMGFRTL